MPHSNTEETKHPGAGTLYVYSATSTRGISPAKSTRRGVSPFAVPTVPKRWEDVPSAKEEPAIVATLDSLLRHGIAEYTYVPHSLTGVLGRGKFSTVYKVTGADGKQHALKHTPLYPHHPLIAARLLREPNLLAELPRHPCLIGVNGWIRTPGHFYLVGKTIRGWPSPSFLSPFTSITVQSGIHPRPARIMWDNVLVNVDTGDVVILVDLGLATRFSMSQPKLTTCCGSPAFHPPEIVLALARPPGEVTYYGPELDIWYIALTLLSLLLQVRFPLGPKHVSTHIMRERAMDRLQELDELYPPHSPWRLKSSRSSRIVGDGMSGMSGQDVDLDFEKREWKRVRKAMEDFLEMDGVRRMKKFRAYEIGEATRQKVAAFEGDQEDKKFKQISFEPADVKYTLPIYVDEDAKKKPSEVITLRNPVGESHRRVKSYIKYLLRSAGILYHVLPSPSSLPDTQPSPGSSIDSLEQPCILQLVVSIPDSATIEPDPSPSPGWLPSILSNFKRSSTPPGNPNTRSVSVPPAKGKSHSPSPAPLGSQGGSNGGSKKDRALRCYIRLEFEDAPAPAEVYRRGSAETFTSMRDSLGLTALHQNQTSSSTSTTMSITPTQSPHPPHPQRSVSASRTTSQRPHPRRAASAIPNTSTPRLSISTQGGMPAHKATLHNPAMMPPPSPLSREVSLAGSPTESDPAQSRSQSCAPSRASSRSRKQSVARSSLLLQHGAYGSNQHPSRQSSLDSKIHIHLSDTRAYAVLLKALDVTPDVGVGMHHGYGDPSLSPMTIRRPSLAPSMAEGAEMVTEEDEEPQRGRARSKEDGSSLLSMHTTRGEANGGRHGVKGKPAPAALSPAKSVVKLPLTNSEVVDAMTPVEVLLDEHGRDRDEVVEMEKKQRDQSRGRQRGLLDVLFGRSEGRGARSSSVPATFAGEPVGLPV
ncbi:serine/threonine protein kinase [Cryptococcus wingfieldii CBS 7118]|uniref:Serine/threonine protein kinase n=1 Tax=Cryptococcus wingfieldii CBS 7118 TaxID=1295528 RepID=A0A1E3J566_9TREE|nr:serine/threonine protein kinase [Cryptococcus wingfieldii CBS 7118]ODN95785.1 serine/threonine protein kinase [Cryptococcus wingfieldii CBS 7118]